MSTNGHHSPAQKVATSFSDLTRDVIELSELQAQLFVRDVKKSSQKTQTCLVFAVVGLCFLLGTIPVALSALAELFVSQFEWTRQASFGVATLIGLVLAAAFAGAAYSMMKEGLLSLQRSRDELNRNIAWLKSTLSSRAGGDSTEKTPV